ncbi:MAG: type II CAAX endopeptidase family protein [Candidatus Lokiarchaeia archaeon]
MEEKYKVTKEEKIKYYRLSKYTCYEILMDSQVASAGAHQARLIEKFKKNKNYIKHQFIALKITFAFLFLFLPILPLFTYFEISEHLSNGTYAINTLFFISSLLFVLYFGLTILYSLMFGMISTSSFMSGNSFKWLQTLPFSKKNLKKIGIMTIFRNLDIPLIVLAIGFPIIMLIATQNILIFLVSLLVSFFNVILSFSILVIIGEKMSYLFSESKSGSKRAGLVRTLTMLGYFIIMFTSSFIFSLGISAVESLFEIFANTEPNIFLIIILSLIPYPFAPAYLISLSTIPGQLQWGLILSSLIGFALFILVVWGLFKYAQKALHSAISTEIKTKKVEKRDLEIEVKPISPIKAYIRKDVVSSTRDIQSFMFVFFPIFYPLLLVLTMGAPIAMEVTSTAGILILWSIILAVYLFIPPMLIVGFLNLEESGSSTVASLPILPRDQAKAKIILMLTIQGLSFILASIVLTILLNSIIVILLLLVTLPIAWTFLLFMFEMKIKLFGQMKYKYVIEELNKENKIIKWIGMILSEVGLYFIILITGIILISFIGLEITILVMGIIGIISLSTLIFVFTRMFPKEEKIRDYVTGGFLREHVNIGSVALMILIFCFGLLVIPIELLFLPIIVNLSFLEVMFLEFAISFGLFALLWFVVVPRGLKLPRKESFKDFSRTIGLSTVKPLWRNIFLGVISIVIFGLSLILVGNLLGTWFLDWSILFVNPSITTGFGWFIFILMLIPGIWEEVAFRGVILNLQLKKYSNRTSIILNGVLFGLFHLTNLIFGADLFLTLMQAIYASCIGIAFAYIYVRTKSLLPAILAHYLLDSVGQLFLVPFFISNPTYLNQALFLILGLGVIPMVLLIGLTKLIVKNNS